MEQWGFVRFMGSISLLVLLFPGPCKGGIQSVRTIHPGFQGSQMTWINYDGLFLISNNSDFAFGFSTTEEDVTRFLLNIVHLGSSKVIWSANRGSPVSNSDNFIFGEDGKVSLQKGEDVVWAADTGGKRVSAIEMLDSGNLVLLGNDTTVLWQSFSHPTNTLISNQDFVDGMKLVSDPNPNNLTHILEIKSGDMILYAGFQTPQPYWSVQKESRIIINQGGENVDVASLRGNSWRFYDGNKVFLSQFIFSDSVDANATWIAVLGSDGFITFYNLDENGSASQKKIPSDPCSRPEPCEAHYVCSGNNVCQCPSGLRTRSNCQTGIVSTCDGSHDSTELVSAGDGLTYFSLVFLPPSSKTNLEGCKSACQSNCSCLAFFFQNSSGNCFQFSNIGSFQNSDAGPSFMAYIKVLSGGGSGSNAGGDGGSKKSFPVVVIIVIATLIAICGLLYVAFRYHRRKKKMPESPLETSEEDNFLETLSGMPIRFSYLPLPPTSSPLGSRLYSSFFKSISGEGTSSGPSDCNSDAYLSSVQLSGPR
ncbi:G-TYPE LECTIN S-RECEPTOR-LIKE SERINE/THREONINE-PROTEIN KINASE SD2-5 [Salix purpurea]|uniref:G-TYPE LECTIN S-RECEPTOR-LIKE SERINE/THREONINE-PROTEIN KINASE SD2-5 n=1 Tax=Salix purpurea TaxID=77065 RepID=A0A9Q0ZFC4_SALPP|nr:G-TYPE LECTIN S-RECEPTOR-LIKE SERINE/THREONINE-PROTEIN KINASE SD2-5 [Salix purpurea]